MLNYVCFTLVSTFNLTPSATDTTGRDGRKTLGFYRLIRLVASCPSFLVLKYKKIVLFHDLICVFHQPLRLVVLVVISYPYIAFCCHGVFAVFTFTVRW